MSGIFQTDKLKPSEIESLLLLQKENLVTNVSEKTATDQGFLTFQYPEDFIIEMMKDMAQPIAKAKDLVIGYALATSIKSASNNQLLKPLVDLCQNISIDQKPMDTFKYYLMGQICVKESWRSVGVFDAMYQKHKELFSASYDFVVTEISVKNKRSMAAHERVGFKAIYQYTENNNVWNVVLWDWK